MVPIRQEKWFILGFTFPALLNFRVLDLVKDPSHLDL